MYKYNPCCGSELPPIPFFSHGKMIQDALREKKE